MGEKRKSKRSGDGKIFLKIINLTVFLFLLANFCWQGEPLWKRLVPAAERGVEESEKIIKNQSAKVRKAAKNVIKKGSELTSEIKESAKEGVKKLPISDISEKDEEELEKIIKQNIEKKDKP